MKINLYQNIKVSPPKITINLDNYKGRSTTVMKRLREMQTLNYSPAKRCNSNPKSKIRQYNFCNEKIEFLLKENQNKNYNKCHKEIVQKKHPHYYGISNIEDNLKKLQINSGFQNQSLINHYNQNYNEKMRNKKSAMIHQTIQDMQKRVN